jgi:hypothetical protein
MTIFKNLASKEELLKQANRNSVLPEKVNGHFHTPYSFSAFDDLNQVFKMAEEENVQVLGINDFYTTAGYDEFVRLCKKHKKFPLFNIEFMGLLYEEQEQGIRVNDPNNPGRTYFSGKGLDYPFSLEGVSLEKLNSVRKESDIQTKEMLAKASAHLQSLDAELFLNYGEILERYTMGLLRERHIAKVIRELVYRKYPKNSQRQIIFSRIFGGKNLNSNLEDTASVDNEIRSNILKSGGVAYVKEDPKAFLEISEIIRIILDAGGIPCYPVLLDDSKGNYTEYESDPETLHKKLSLLNVHSLELIPGRNKYSNLKRFVEFFDNKNYVITFGTEHNTPVMEPLTVRASDRDMDEYLTGVSYEGACVIAAHQYLRSRGEKGYVDSDGMPAKRQEFVLLGNEVIRNFIN